MLWLDTKFMDSGQSVLWLKLIVLLMLVYVLNISVVCRVWQGAQLYIYCMEVHCCSCCCCTETSAMASPVTLEYACTSPMRINVLSFLVCFCWESDRVFSCGRNSYGELGMKTEASDDIYSWEPKEIGHLNGVQVSWVSMGQAVYLHRHHTFSCKMHWVVWVNGTRGRVRHASLPHSYDTIYTFMYAMDLQTFTGISL